jgi:hypothetical protein
MEGARMDREGEDGGRFSTLFLTFRDLQKDLFALSEHFKNNTSAHVHLNVLSFELLDEICTYL